MATLSLGAGQGLKSWEVNALTEWCNNCLREAWPRETQGGGSWGRGIQGGNYFGLTRLCSDERVFLFSRMAFTQVMSSSSSEHQITSHLWNGIHLIGCRGWFHCLVTNMQKRGVWQAFVRIETNKEITNCTKYEKKSKKNSTPDLRGKPKSKKTTGRLEPE